MILLDHKTFFQNRLSFPQLRILSYCVILLTVQCTTISQPPQPLTLTWVNASTSPISPVPTLQFALSSSIADSSVDFVFSPPVGANYSVYLNASHDTITLSFIDMLAGSTTYMLRLKSALHSTAGATLDPTQDSIVFTTAACEHEPNDIVALADTLGSSPTYGMISEATDTDVYFVPSAPRGRLCLLSIDACDTLLLFDSLGRGVAAPVSAASASGGDTLTVPDSIGYPVYVKVFSCVNGTTGMYRIEAVPH
jgi:hypothetical protein